MLPERRDRLIIREIDKDHKLKTEVPAHGREQNLLLRSQLFEQA